MIYRIVNLIQFIFMGFICNSCTAEPVDICDYKNDPISYDCVQGIFDLNCVECHNISNAQKPYLDTGISYSEIVNIDNSWGEYKYIVPVSPLTSHIFLAISEAGQLDKNWFMPRDRPSLDQNKIDYIENWINAGAIPN